jgi:nucleotide-binding universal stress UspA family protein
VREVLGDRPDIDVTQVVAEGYPAPVLLDRARDAELLVVDSRGHGELSCVRSPPSSSFAGMLFGSVSEHCVSRATCPVVVVRGNVE